MEKIKNNPLIDKMIALEEIVWINPDMDIEKDRATRSVTINDMKQAEARLERFAKAIEVLFPETSIENGILESPLTKISNMQYALGNIKGNLYLKRDCDLKVAGSIKARGGIYEVMKHAESLAINAGLLKESDDYAKMASPEMKKFFSNYKIAVGSTGNLGLSIGISAIALGFDVTVHMSSDAKQWKKDMLRSKGVNVVEYSSDYSKAVEEGRKIADKDETCHFIDDENSLDLFMGYSVAALRLQKQLKKMNINVDEKNPLIVYVPCGVGGAPGGICYGLKQVFNSDVHVFFVEPTHSPCMLLGLATGLNSEICVQDIGIDNITIADGLAVGRASGFIGKTIKYQLDGEYTIADEELYKLLYMLYNEENIKVEPSAAASLIGPVRMSSYLESIPYIENANHIAWATGGSMVPDKEMQEFIARGETELK